MNLTRFNAKLKNYSLSEIDEDDLGDKIRFYELTLDYDLKDYNPNRLKRKLRTLLCLYPDENIQIRYSASKKNYHVRIIFDSALTPAELMSLRARLGDDRMRLMLDCMRLKEKCLYTINVIFDKKYNKRAGRWHKLTEDTIKNGIKKS